MCRKAWEKVASSGGCNCMIIPRALLLISLPVPALHLRHMLSRVLLSALCALAVTYAAADAPDCSTLSSGGCHILAYCEGTATNPFCTCQPGTIDVGSGDGLDCEKNAFAIRYVGTFDLSRLGISTAAEVASLPAPTAQSAFCPAGAEGYFVRATRLGWPFNPFNESIPSVIEANCLYRTKPDAVDASYTANISVLLFQRVDPAIYKWTLQTTSSPLQIPATGMVVNSVHFKPACADSGCWVIRGTLTTGEAFNTFDVFNTLFLPQADISAVHPQGILSYDYTYDENVELTFSPANHPCTSVGYQAGVSGMEKISSCCIDYPGTGQPGGFIPNYRPTEAFVNWADTLKCDEKFQDKDGNDVCWRVYAGPDQPDWWTTANLRCEAAGGYLAVVDDADENERLRALLEKHGLASAWIGMQDDPEFNQLDGEAASKKFIWVDGSPIEYTNWTNGTPLPQLCALTYDYTYQYSIDNLYLYVTDEILCGEMDYVFMDAATGAWGIADQRGNVIEDDVTETSRGGNGLPFVCAFDPPSECISHVIQRPQHSAPQPDPDFCWEVGSSFGNWDAAQADCEALGGGLVTLDGLKDHFLLWRLLTNENVETAWIGLTDAAEEGVWKWLDGRPVVADAEDAWYEYDWYYFSQNATFETKFWGVTDVSDYFDYYDYYDNPEANERRDCAYFDREGALWRQDECGGNLPLRHVCNLPRENAAVCHSDSVTADDAPWDIPFPLQYQKFFGRGKFKGMDVSPGIVEMKNTDPFFGQFDFEIELDEVELRTKAGKLRGTVGVEHTVDTFLGLANFRPTGGKALDTFASQTAIHLEKTSFFSVSTHGTNEYTFLEYVNMRLVQVLNEDSDFSGAPAAGTNDDEAGDRTVRTDKTGNAAYVQVTFTMGPQYGPNAQSGGLIPLASVRAGLGTFFADADAAGDLEHVCQEFDAAAPADDIGLTGYRDQKSTFETLVGQPSCGPRSNMCASPSSVPDSFVSFNVPLGFEVFDELASATLDSNVFVDMVVNAVDTSATGVPNDGDDSQQLKTTLTASIPIVDGGVNIFCDGVTAKTDLKDVANVDIVVGTAKSEAELTRLRILEDVASTDLAPEAASQIDTASIESALMTLVLKGNTSYFGGLGRNSLDYSMELDDVITLHMMEDGAASTSTKEATVTGLLSTPGADNSDTNGLDTDGYPLNGAFSFTVDRTAGTASLEPSTALLAACPFNPPRPLENNMPLETCVTRRDVQLRGYPSRAGADATAMEILAASRLGLAPKDSTQAAVDAAAATLGDDSAESTFLATILGASSYTANLAPDFVRALHARYELNGRYRRAYWINPGYEWTPTQTAGQSIFAVSQKIFLFALISLDENWGRRRMLLQASSDAMEEAGAGVGQASVVFSVSPASMLSSTFGVEEELVGLFRVEMQLKREEACLDPPKRQAAVRETLHGYLSADAASPFWTVQVVSLAVDLGGEQCPSGRRVALRQRRAGYSAATAVVEMMIVFKKGQPAQFNRVAFEQMEGITAVQPDPRNSPSIDAEATEIKPWDFEEDEGSGSSNSNTLLIAGICGGVGAAVVLVAAFFLMRRSSDSSMENAEIVTSINVSDLKAELGAIDGANDAGRNGGSEPFNF